MSVTAHDVALLEDCLAGDGVAVIPTDTVYGLACDPASEIALRRIYELKRRPLVKPSAVMFFAVEPVLEYLVELGPRTRAALDALLPGPVTLLLPNPERRFPLACDPTGAESGALGLRVPTLDGPLRALASVAKPAAQSSANFASGPEPRRLRDVAAELREAADLVLDGGELPGTASTVIDLLEYERRGRWRIVREGPLTHDAIASALA